MSIHKGRGRRAAVCSAAVLCVLVGGLCGNGRADELVGGLELGARYEPVQDLKLAVGGQLRLDEGFSRIQRWAPEAELSYDPFKRISLGTGYRLIYGRNGQGEFEIAHRVFVQVAYTLKLKSLDTKLKYRLRVQDRFEREVGSPTEHQPRVRNALELSYAGWMVAAPFISAEHFLAPDRLADEPTRRWRLVMGFDRQQGPTDIEMFYRLDLPVGNDDAVTHMIALGLRWDIGQ